jgi:hypothetical protein
MADQPGDPQGSARVGVVAPMIRRIVARALREAGWILDDLADHVYPLERPASPAPSVDVTPVVPGQPWIAEFDPVVTDAHRAFFDQQVGVEPFLWGCGEGHVE